MPSYINWRFVQPANKTFYLSTRDDRSLDSDVHWNENKILLNKIMNICMNNLDFRERWDGQKTSRKGHFGPTITIPHTWTSTRPCHGQNYSFYRLSTFISGTALYHSYFGGMFCFHGSNLRLVLGHSRTTPQVVFFTRSWQKPRLALNALFIWPEKASRKRQVLETLEQFHPIPMNKKNPANNLLWCLKLQVESGVNHVPPKCYTLLSVSSILPVL